MRPSAQMPVLLSLNLDAFYISPLPFSVLGKGSGFPLWCPMFSLALHPHLAWLLFEGIPFQGAAFSETNPETCQLPLLRNHSCFFLVAIVGW